MNHVLSGEPDWKFIEKRAPGARAAWPSDLPDREFTVGLTGSPLRAQATDKVHYRMMESGRTVEESFAPTVECRCLVYDQASREWKRRTHVRQ